MESDDLDDLESFSDDLDAALEEQLKLIRQFKLPDEKYTVHDCRCSGSNSRVIRHPELSRSRQESIMVDECRCDGSNSRVMRHSELSQGAQHTEETRKIHHKNTGIVVEDDVDAGLEQRLRLIRQSDWSEKEQSSNKVEVMRHCSTKLLKTWLRYPMSIFNKGLCGYPEEKQPQF